MSDRRRPSPRPSSGAAGNERVFRVTLSNSAPVDVMASGLTVLEGVVMLTQDVGEATLVVAAIPVEDLNSVLRLDAIVQT